MDVHTCLCVWRPEVNLKCHTHGERVTHRDLELIDLTKMTCKRGLEIYWLQVYMALHTIWERRPS